MVMRKSNPCDHCPPLTFIVSRGGAQGEIQKKVTVLGSWYVPLYVVVRQVVLTSSCDTLSGEPPCGWVELFLPGLLAFSPSSLGLP
jgi:hypothetical protein